MVSHPRKVESLKIILLSRAQLRGEERDYRSEPSVRSQTREVGLPSGPRVMPRRETRLLALTSRLQSSNARCCVNPHSHRHRPLRDLVNAGRIDTNAVRINDSPKTSRAPAPQARF
uniref:Uncharacterized protein n=1 Tax=Schizophyllum commune (strain H4-8 / FGSC 9210) TaxID=578458 RepID=D8PPA0_SCHCM